MSWSTCYTSSHCQMFGTLCINGQYNTFFVSFIKLYIWISSLDKGGLHGFDYEIIFTHIHRMLFQKCRQRIPCGQVCTCAWVFGYCLRVLKCRLSNFALYIVKCIKMDTSILSNIFTLWHPFLDVKYSTSQILTTISLTISNSLNSQQFFSLLRCQIIFWVTSKKWISEIRNYKPSTFFQGHQQNAWSDQVLHCLQTELLLNFA